jgi:hypothetical protein
MDFRDDSAYTVQVLSESVERVKEMRAKAQTNLEVKWPFK